LRRFGVFLCLLFVVFGAAPSSAADLSLPKFVTMQAGSFLMGSPASDDGRRGDELPRTSVVVERAFALAVTEVTAELWREVMGEAPSYFTDCEDCPVESVTWFEALDFCNVLSEREGLQPVYEQRGGVIVWHADADGYRLPSEVEWEYACRAGGAAVFHDGDCLVTSEANFDGSVPHGGCDRGLHREQPLPVASFSPNAWGLYDMHGNVAEWCWNTSWRYGEDPTPGAGEEDLSALRSVRGGGWISRDIGCRSAARIFIAPDSRFDFIGLRLARTPAEDGP